MSEQIHLVACPFCDAFVRSDDWRDQGFAEREHMEREHPEIIERRLREAGFERDESGAWVDMLVVAERIKGMRWTIYVCAEPDGENCASGTHPNILSHRCAAIHRFHESEGREPGPRLATVKVMTEADWRGSVAS